MGELPKDARSGGESASAAQAPSSSPSLEEQLARLSPAKRALLELKLKRGGGGGTESSAALSDKAAGADSAAPLSFAQQRLWFLSQLDSDGFSYNVPRAFRLVGKLDQDALTRALNEILRRHGALRTTFGVHGGVLQQVVQPDSQVEFPLVDISDLSPEQRTIRIHQAMAEEYRRTFDLASGPLFRAMLLRAGDHEHILLLNSHHIVSDAWSKDVLYREIGTLYNAYRGGKPSPLSELPSQYADFARWQHRWVQRDEFAGELDYWRQHLSGEIPSLELPTDFRRPAELSKQGAIQEFELPNGLSKALLDLGRTRRCTPFMTLLAGFIALMHRYSGQDDFVVGSLIANRNRIETENLIGVFINDLALRADVSGDPTFLELLDRVREVAVSAYAHQDVPFEKVLEELQPGRDLSRNAMFQVMFQLQAGTATGLLLDGLDVETLPVERVISLVDLSISITDRDGTFSGVLEYSTDLFKAERIRQMLSHYQRLLEAMVANPKQEISEPELLTPAEKPRVTVEWSTAAGTRPLDRCFQQLFEDQVERTLDAIAVECGADTLTYSELNRAANRLAWALSGQGISAGSVVAVHGHRSIEFLVAMLGIFKAGAAYLPLDPSHPVERTIQVLRQSSVNTVLMLEDSDATVSGVRSALPDGPTWYRVADLLQRSTKSENPPPQAGPEDLAYILFTSGSTGVPKGAMVEHRGMLNHIFAKIDAVGLASGDVLAQNASTMFVVSIWQFLAALVVGATLEILTDDVAQDPRAMLAALTKNVTVIELVPSMLAAMLDELPTGAQTLPTGDLRWMILTGEPIPPHLLTRYFAVCSTVPVLNAYGCTECSDDVAHHVLTEPLDPRAISVPAGRPVPNAHLYILDGNNKPMPPGIPGELCVGGVQVGRGYVNDPERTRERFTPDPFSNVPGGKLYRTGDRARWLADGVIELLGRRDHQIKIRGLRIELEEIDAALNAHPAVRRAISATAENAQGGSALVAYVVAGRGQEVSTDDLRSFLQQRLPEYMVPSVFVKLDAMPLTSSGKINRRALSQMSLPAESARAVDEKTPVQEMLAGIWCEVLGKSHIGVDDNFFQLGGHSLLGVRVIARVRDVLNIDLPVRALFENSTIASMAKRIEAGRDVAKALPPLRRIPRGGDLPLSAAQQRLWVLEQLDPENSSYNTYRVTRLRGTLNVQALERAFRELLARHESLRTSFVARSGKPVAVLEDELSFQLNTIDLSAMSPSSAEAEAMRLAADEVSRPFDLGCAPLVRATLLRLTDSDHVLTTTLHHIISDAWSAGIVFRELGMLYNGFSTGKHAEMPPPALQYADFAAWQSEWLQGERLNELLAYWRERLSDAPELLAMPTDYPRPSARSTRGKIHPLALSPDILSGVRKISRENGVTLFMTLLSAFQLLLSYWTGQQSVVVGSPVAGRSRSEFEPIVGFFINTLAFRADFNGDASFLEILRNTRETALAAYAHQDLPFDRLVDELHPARTMEHNPVFQAWFVLQTAPTSELQLQWIAVTPLDVESGFVRHDLSLEIRESDEQLRCSFGYRSDLFEEQTIVKLAELWSVLLGQVISEPTAPQSALRERLDAVAKQRQAAQQDLVEQSAHASLGTARRKKMHN